MTWSPEQIWQYAAWFMLIEIIVKLHILASAQRAMFKVSWERQPPSWRDPGASRSIVRLTMGG